jgi:hypothetical protein
MLPSSACRIYSIASVSMDFGKLRQSPARSRWQKRLQKRLESDLLERSNDEAAQVYGRTELLPGPFRPV